MWVLNGSELPVTDISQIPEGCVGFVYEIRNYKTGEYYIGKKNIFQHRTLPPLKGTKRKRKVTKEANWLDYQSSSKKVKEWKYVQKVILKYCYSKKELTYEETRALMCNYAMEDPKCVNENIAGKYFKHEFNYEQNN